MGIVTNVKKVDDGPWTHRVVISEDLFSTLFKQELYRLVLLHQ
jgi:hypothetical protein